MFTNMTMLSRQAIETAMDEMLTVEEAVMYLEEQLGPRNLRDKIDRYSGGKTEKEIKGMLVSGLLENHPEMNRDSVERRVRGWMDPKSTRSLLKKDAIEAAFLLGLNLQDADAFVASVCGEKLHYRNADEIVYIYALNNGLKFPEAVALSEKLKDVLSQAKDSKDIKDLKDSDFTLSMRAEIENLHTEEELRDFLYENIGRIGHLHNQAYQLFMEMLSSLQNPVDDTDSEQLWEDQKEKMTVRDVLREYLYGDFIQTGKKKDSAPGKRGKKREASAEDAAFITAMKREIMKGWPDETTLSKMQARKTDVTRKTLILLFLATDEGYDVLRKEYDQDGDQNPAVLHYDARHPYITDTEDGDRKQNNGDGIPQNDRSDEEDPDFLDYLPTRDEAFEDMKNRLDYMLTMSGFSKLDPRSSFDWLVLYCMCVEDVFDMDDRMRNMFFTMFGKNEE